jgi:hypothetical protein
MATGTHRLDPLAATGGTLAAGVERVPEMETAAHPEAVPLRFPGAPRAADARSARAALFSAVGLEEAVASRRVGLSRLDGIGARGHDLIIVTAKLRGTSSPPSLLAGRERGVYRLSLERVVFDIHPKVMRSITLLAGLLPYLYYGTRDQILHVRGRRVSVSEHLLHVAIAVTVLMVVTQALKSQYPLFLVGLALFLVAGGIDEFVFHRGISGEESDLHSKAHLALLGWIVLVLAIEWLPGHGFRIGGPVTDLSILHFLRPGARG